MINVKLTKISDNKNNLRTNEIIGYCLSLPTVGKSFTIFGEGIEFGTRMITTSLVVEMSEQDSDEKIIIFRTQNSLYRVELLDSKN